MPPIRPILLCFVSLILLSSIVKAEEPDRLANLVKLALQRNQELDALSFQIDALQYKATQSGAWKDPKFSFAYQNVPWDSFALDQEPMSMVLFRIEQTVPFFGKTGKREAVVNNEAKAKRWELEERKSQLSALVKQAYYRLALARQIKKITEEHISLIEQLIDAVRIKYEVGRAAQSDLLRLEVLRDKLKDSVEDFDRQDRELTATINAALHRGVATKITTPEAFTLTAPSHTIKELKKYAMNSRPQLKQLQAIAKMHRSAADLASTEAIPDPTFFASYALRSKLEAGGAGRDLVTLGVGFPLPLFYGSSYDARAEEATASARATDARRRALLDMIAGGLGEAHANWRRAFDQVNRYRDQLVPGAHRALDATFSSYQVDRADFSSLYEAELELLNFERTIHLAAVQGLLAQTRIEQLIGRKL